jgi:hypothetical protein
LGNAALNEEELPRAVTTGQRGIYNVAETDDAVSSAAAFLPAGCFASTKMLWWPNASR